MITITLPEWLAWALVVFMALSLVNQLLDIFIRHLDRKLKGLKP